MRQYACLVINPITVDNFVALFNCTPVDRASDSMMARPKAIHFSWLEPDLFCCLVHRGSTDDLLLLQISSGFAGKTRDLHQSCNTLYLLIPRLCFFIVLRRDLCVYREDSLKR